AAPRNWTDVAILQIVFVDDELFDSVELGNGIRNLEIEQLGRGFEPLRMLGRFENAAAIGPLALKHAGRIVQPMREHMELGLLPGDQTAVHPNETVALIERQ